MMTTEQKAVRVKQLANYYCRPVEKRPTENPKRFEIVDVSNGKILSTVSDRYTLAQNNDVIAPVIQYFGAERVSKFFGYGAGRYTHLEVETGREFDFGYKGESDIIKERLVVQNSYDKTKKLSIMMGAFRLICTNGLYTGALTLAVVTRHVGKFDAAEIVSEGINRYSANSFDLWRDFAARPMDADEEIKLASEFKAFEEKNEKGEELQGNILLNKQIVKSSRMFIERSDSVDNRRDAFGLLNQINRGIAQSLYAKSAINRMIAANVKAEQYVKSKI